MEDKKRRPQAARSLMATLTIAFFVMSTVLLLVGGSMAIFSNYRAYQDTLATRQLFIAQDASKTVANSIQEKFSVLETAVEFGNLVTGDSDAKQNVLESLLGRQPAFKQLALLNTAGQQDIGVSRQSSSLSKQFESNLQGDVLEQIKAGQRYISPVYIDELTSEPLVVIAIPAQSVFGEFRGVLAAELNLKFMWDLVEQLEVGETGYAYVVDNQGKLIAFGDTSRVLRGEYVGQIPTVQEFLAKPTQTSDTTSKLIKYTGLQGQIVVGNYVPLGTPPWAVFTELPTHEANQPIIRLLMASVAIILVFAVLVGFAGNILARRLSAPLIELSNVAIEISRGNLGLQAKVSGPVEIAQVAFTFNSMTSRLREFIATLEQRVADRTKALATSTEVSRRLSTILNEKQLVIEVVEQVKAAFDYYHVHIYMMDKTSGDLFMAGGTGDAGASMLESGHKIPRGKGLVGRAAQNNLPVLVSDTSQDPSWLPNPLLPETRSEVAVPIATADEVLGVLDVQHNKVGGLQQEDVDLLQSLANQVAIALLNARSYVEIQQRADREARITSIGLKIKSTTSIEAALKATVRELGRTLDANDIQAILEAPGLAQHSQKPD